MRMVDIIQKKRDGYELTEEEIEYFVKNSVSGEIPDYQLSALFMAIYYKGMSEKETAILTKAMLYSGETIDLSEIPGIKVDKHSTGGVGDTTTLILAPLVAAAGVPVAKMSGRGLGHTGGTIDKLESIPGFNVNLNIKEFIDAVKRVGVAIAGQTGSLVPADKKFYALRDVTATVDSIPLIASSIMSKKLASGADAIVLDVKTGSGAFMKTLDDSFLLAKSMVDIGNSLNRNTVALITDMNQPLGLYIGNSLEVIDAIQVLKGESEGPLKEVSLLLGSYMLLLANKVKNIEEGKTLLNSLIKNGSAIKKFKELIKSQNGNPDIVDNTDLLPKANIITEVKSEKEGYINNIQSENIGKAAMILGAGRIKKEDKIDLSAGLILKKRCGDYIEKGEVLAVFHYNNKDKYEEAKKIFLDAFQIEKDKKAVNPFVYGVVTKDGIKRF